jgi:hypothetical protein
MATSRQRGEGGPAKVNKGPMAGLVVVAVVFAVGFAIAGFFLPPGNAAIPTSLAFTMIAVVVAVLGQRLKSCSDRIDRLERLLASPKYEGA